MTSNESAAGYYLAKLDIARMKTPLNDPVMADFLAAPDPSNASAEACADPGG